MNKNNESIIGRVFNVELRVTALESSSLITTKELNSLKDRKILTIP
jgi:hypothetical protein